MRLNAVIFCTLKIALIMALIITPLSGCTAATPRSPFSPTFTPHVPTTIVSCEQANRIAYDIIKEVGYTPTKLILATSERPGLLEGTRGRAGGEDIAQVMLTCAADGVHVRSEYGGWAGFGAMNRKFPEYFYERFIATADALHRHKLYVPPDSMQVTVTPLKGFDAQLEFGSAVTGILPVRVEITNTTSEPYLLDAEQFVLLTAEGKRINALQHNETAFPVSPLTSQTLAPGTHVKGYLYYPPGTYMSARGILVEESTKERSGFNVQFSNL